MSQKRGKTMALTKRQYVDGVTVITAENLNAIQDEIIQYRVSDVTYNSTTHKISKTLNGTSTVVATLGSVVDFDVVEVTT